MQWFIKCATFAIAALYGMAVNAEPYDPEPGAAFSYTPNEIGSSYYSNPTGMQSFYCYQNASYIKVGMTVGEVLAACGTPKSQHKQKVATMAKHPVKQWVYQIAPTAASTGFLQFSVGNSIPVMIGFKDNKVNVIQVAGQNAQSTSTLCSGPVSKGDSPDQVTAACGEPTVHNETFENVDTGQESEIETWTYQPRPSDKMVTLTFVNGLLDTIAQ